MTTTTNGNNNTNRITILPNIDLAKTFKQVCGKGKAN